MAKILILYDSATGNTESMAKYVAEGAREIEGSFLRIKNVNDADKEDISWCQGIAVGAPTNMGLLSWKMKRFWDEEMQDLWGKIDGKIGCAFSSSGGWGGGSELTCMSILTVLMNFGFLVFGIPDYVADKFTLHYGSVVAGEPRENKEIDSCRRLGRRLVEWVDFYAEGNKSSFPKLFRM